MTPRNINIGVTHYRSNSEPAELSSPMQWLTDQNQLQDLGKKCEAYGSGGSHAEAGKDGSRSWTVSVSNLRTENVLADCIVLKEKVFDDLHPFLTRISHSLSIYPQEMA